MEVRVCTLFIIGSSFRKQHTNLFGATENAFVFRPKTASSSKDSAEPRMKNLFAKHQRKHSAHNSHFIAILSVRPFFTAVSEWCVVGYRENTPVSYELKF